jgi:hypothetical protein
LIFFILIVQGSLAQQFLPNITVTDFNGKMVVSWQNAYKVPVTNINIQRSFDSTKNYTTIGSVLNPQNIENGYADNKPPYNKMYYRVFISFEGGSYLFSSIVRPIKDIPVKDTSRPGQPDISDNIRYPWQVNPFADYSIQKPPLKDSLIIINDPEHMPYPSQVIYTARENNVVIHLQDPQTKKYIAKFYDDAGNFLFELTKLKEEYFIVEKVNFMHVGWFHFELFENGKLIEKNKFFIGKDVKNENNK